MMKIARALPSTEPRTKRAANARGRLWPMAALFIRGSVLGSASVAESASAFSGQPRTRERGPLRADAVGRSLSASGSVLVYLETARSTHCQCAARKRELSAREVDHIQ